MTEAEAKAAQVEAAILGWRGLLGHCIEVDGAQINGGLISARHAEVAIEAAAGRGVATHEHTFLLHPVQLARLHAQAAVGMTRSRGSASSWGFTRVTICGYTTWAASDVDDDLLVLSPARLGESPNPRGVVIVTGLRLP